MRIFSLWQQYSWNSTDQRHGIQYDAIIFSVVLVSEQDKIKLDLNVRIYPFPKSVICRNMWNMLAIDKMSTGGKKINKEIRNHFVNIMRWYFWSRLKQTHNIQSMVPYYFYLFNFLRLNYLIFSTKLVSTILYHKRIL